MLGDLSLRYKVPLRTGVLIVGVCLAITASLLFRAYRVFQNDLLVSSGSMVRILSQTLTPALLHDDVWKAYETIMVPVQTLSVESALQPIEVLVIDRESRVYAASDPVKYRILTSVGELDAGISHVVQTLGSRKPDAADTVEWHHPDRLFVAGRIESDGVPLGTLVMVYRADVFSARFSAFSGQAVLTTFTVAALLLPLGAYWGRRIAEPLVALSESMDEIQDPSAIRLSPTLPRGGDEIGRLVKRFEQVLLEMEEKAQLEKQMVVVDRLAAIGRFTAGVAHEINNPLGGLLNAANTLKRHGSQDDLTQKTVRLIERGLLQIRDTVAALLVEAKADEHPLCTQDIEDVRTLLLPELEHKNARLVWRNQISDDVPVPATLLRQVLINLLLNAVSAVPDGGSIEFEVESSKKMLIVSVANEGEQIGDEMLGRLFEPFESRRKNGKGLGLWVTYQIVQGLGGEIAVSSGVEDTRFQVQIPLEDMT